MTEQPTTPGWYQHPEMINTLCYWDGTAWTDKVQPMSDTTKAVDAGVKKIVGAILAIVILVVVGLLRHLGQQQCRLRVRQHRPDPVGADHRGLLTRLVSEAPSTVSTMALIVREHMLLKHAELRGNWFTREGTLRHVFGTTPTLVRAELVALVDRADAEAEYPVLVHRLRRLRQARRRQRSQARLVG